MINRLDSAYKKTPFYNEVMPIVFEVLNLETDRLATLNIESIRAVRAYLDLLLADRGISRLAGARGIAR